MDDYLKFGVKDLNSPTTSACDSTAHHYQQQQQSLLPINSDNNAQLMKRKSNKSTRGKADKMQEGGVQEDIGSIPDHILVSIFLLPSNSAWLRLLPGLSEFNLGEID